MKSGADLGASQDTSPSPSHTTTKTVCRLIGFTSDSGCERYSDYSSIIVDMLPTTIGNVRPRSVVRRIVESTDCGPSPFAYSIICCQSDLRRVHMPFPAVVTLSCPRVYLTVPYRMFVPDFDEMLTLHCSWCGLSFQSKRDF